MELELECKQHRERLKAILDLIRRIREYRKHHPGPPPPPVGVPTPQLSLLKTMEVFMSNGVMMKYDFTVSAVSASVGQRNLTLVSTNPGDSAGAPVSIPLALTDPGFSVEVAVNSVNTLTLVDANFSGTQSAPGTYSWTATDTTPPATPTITLVSSEEVDTGSTSAQPPAGS
jgi:hypothetical protein